MDPQHLYQLAASLGQMSQAFAPPGTNIGKLGEGATSFAQSAIQAEAEKKAKEEAEKAKKGALGGGIGGTLGSAALAAIPGVGPIASAGLAAAGGAAGSAAGSAIAGGGGGDPAMAAIQGGMNSVLSNPAKSVDPTQTTQAVEQAATQAAPPPVPQQPSKIATSPTGGAGPGQFSGAPKGMPETAPQSSGEQQKGGFGQWFDNFKALLPQFMDNQQRYNSMFNPNVSSEFQMERDVNGNLHVR